MKWDRNQVLVHVSHPLGRAFVRPMVSLAHHSLKKLGLKDCELSIALVSDQAIRALNRKWRNKDRPTDVLSFSAGDASPLADGKRILGDVVISLDTARRRVAGRGAMKAELSRYLVHGFLHLLGYDHRRKGDARRMQKAEEDLLGAEGLLHQ